MYAITVIFSRFADVKFEEVLNSKGVYVIWDSQARAKPSYIGKGDLLARLSTHDSRFARPIRGYFALTGRDGLKAEDNDALIVEALLLEVAGDTDRFPTHNKKIGHLSLVERVFDRYGKVRVTIKGHDPFTPPKFARLLEEPKAIWFELDSCGDVVLQHHWRLRKLQKS